VAPCDIEQNYFTASSRRGGWATALGRARPAIRFSKLESDVICKELMTLPRFEAQQWRRGAKARLGRGHAVDFSPGRLLCSTDLDPLTYRAPRIDSVANSIILNVKTVGITKMTDGGGTTIGPSFDARGAQPLCPSFITDRQIDFFGRIPASRQV
jgi:hypothetical protein